MQMMLDCKGWLAGEGTTPVSTRERPSAAVRFRRSFPQALARLPTLMFEIDEALFCGPVEADETYIGGNQKLKD